MKKRSRKKAWSRMLCIFSVVALVLSGCSKGKTATEDNTVAERVTEETVSESEKRLREAGTGTPASKKEEMVYANAKADGTVYETTVKTKLILDSNRSGIISEKTELSDLKNTEGEEEFIELKKGEYLWENKGSDIQYEGTSTKELPVKVNYTFSLDGKTVQPEELVGKSGHVTIRADYENLETRKISVENTSIDTVVPFTALTMFVLDEEKFSNVTVTNGKVTNLSDMQIVIGYAMPGVEEALEINHLNLDALEDLTDEKKDEEEIEIPSYIEMEADVTDFALEFSATMVTPGLLSDLSTDTLKSFESALEGLSDLGDASEKIQDGVKKLDSAMTTFDTQFGTFKDGVHKLHNGADSVKSSMSQILTAGKTLEDGAGKIDDALQSINEALKTQNKNQEIDVSELESMKTVLEAIGTDIVNLVTVAGQFQQSYTDLAGYKTLLEEYDTHIKEQAQQAKDQLDMIDISSLPEEQQGVIQDTITQAQGNLQDIQETSLPEQPVYSVDTELFSEASADLGEQIELLTQTGENLVTTLSGLDGISDQINELKTGINTLCGYSNQLTAGMKEYNQGLQKLYQEGVVAVADGTKNLDTAAGSFGQGIRTLKTSVKQFKSGYDTFHEEGIQKLADAGDSDAILLLRRIRALKKADESYDNFAGKCKGQESSVAFLIETDEIK